MSFIVLTFSLITNNFYFDTFPSKTQFKKQPQPHSNSIYKIPMSFYIKSNKAKGNQSFQRI